MGHDPQVFFGFYNNRQYPKGAYYSGRLFVQVFGTTPQVVNKYIGCNRSPFTLRSEVSFRLQLYVSPLIDLFNSALSRVLVVVLLQSRTPTWTAPPFMSVCFGIIVPRQFLAHGSKKRTERIEISLLIIGLVRQLTSLRLNQDFGLKSLVPSKQFVTPPIVLLTR